MTTIKHTCGVIVCILTLLAVSCTTIPVESYTPRSNQQRWINESEARDTILDCIEGANFATRRPAAIRKYAMYMRMCYSYVSSIGADEDAGVRALNYMKHVHFEAKGSKKLWQEVLKLAKTHANDNDPKRLPGMQLPAQYDMPDYIPPRPAK